MCRPVQIRFISSKELVKYKVEITSTPAGLPFSGDCCFASHICVLFANRISTVTYVIFLEHVQRVSRKFCGRGMNEAFLSSL